MYRRPITKEVYLLTLEELSKIPEGVKLLTLSMEQVTKPPQNDIEARHFRDAKNYTKYGWTHALAAEQGLEELFVLFLLGS